MKLNCEAEKKCKHCKKKVVLSVDCVICGSNYHPSCAFQAKVVDCEERVVCCRQPGESEVKLANLESLDLYFEKMDEKKLKSVIKNMLQESLSPFKQEIEKSMQHMSDTYDEQKLAFEKLVTEIKGLRKENLHLRQRLEVVEAKLDEIEQKDKANNLIVVGVPKQKEKDISSSVKKIFESVKASVDGNDIKECYRLGKVEDGPILVRLNNYAVKKEILVKIRQHKGTSVRKCGLEGDDRKIYLNEDLTTQKRLLFKKARERKTENGYKAVYCLNGKIFVRKNDTDPPIKIVSLKDL